MTDEQSGKVKSRWLVEPLVSAGVCRFLTRLMPQLIASGLAALVGAGVGGWITYFVVTEDLRKELVSGAYASYVREASHALTLAQHGKFGVDDTYRLGRETSVLTIFGSKEVMCRAMNFERSVIELAKKSDSSNHNFSRMKYGELAKTMREEVLGEKFGATLENCVPPRPPATNPASIQGDNMPRPAVLDPARDLAGATPETLARALFRPLRPRAGGESVVGDEPPVGEGLPHEPGDESPHLVEGV